MVKEDQDKKVLALFLLLNNFRTLFYFEGGDGDDGFQVANASLSQVDCNYSKRGINDYICEPNNNKTRIVGFFEKKSTFSFKHNKWYYLLNDGECGTNGKDSGEGGVGGLSGFPGVFKSMSEDIHYKNARWDQLGITAKHGKAGLGGYQGDSAKRQYYIGEVSVFAKITSFGINSVLDENGYENDADFTIPSIKRCNSTQDGNNPKEKNSKAQIQPQKSNTDFYSHETEYLNFISKLELKESRLLEREFCKHLLKNI